MVKTSSQKGESQSYPAFDLHNSRSAFLVSLLLFVFVTWVYLPALRGRFMFYDENGYVLANHHVNSGLTWENIAWAFSSLDYANWHPLTWLSHMSDVQLYGLDPWGHHLSNILFHALNTVLVFLVFRKMTGAAWRSLFVAILFGLHPLRVESVAWISERKDVLSTMFWLLAMWTYAKFAEESHQQAWKMKLFYGLTLLFFVMGLMSKTMLVTLPFVFLLLDFWPLKRWEKSKWNLVFEKIPFFVFAIIVSIVSYIAQQRGGMMQEMLSLPFSDRLGNAVVSYVRYLGKFFWPESLCNYYPHPGHWPTTEALAASLFLIYVSLLAVSQCKQRRYLVVGWFWYLGTLVPVIGLVQLCSQSMADRYTYIPLMGVYVLLSWGACELTERWRHQIAVLATLAVMATIACAILTRYEIGFWKNDPTVWRRAVAVAKNNYVAHNSLGIIHIMQTQPAAAFDEFQEAVRINPDFADGQRNLAAMLIGKNLLDEAIVHLQKSLETDPGFAWAENALGSAFYKKGQVEEAITHFHKALAIESENADAHNNLGTALLQKRQVDEAIVQFQKALAIKPDFTEAHYNLGNQLLQKGQVDEAIIHFQKALVIKPDYAQAHNNLGAALFQKGLLDEAIIQFQKALAIQPSLMEAQSDLDRIAWMMATSPNSSVRNGTKAVKLAQQTDQLSGSKNLVMIATLAAAYAEAGQFDDAIVTAQRACDLATQHNEKDLLRKNQELLERIAKFNLFRAQTD